jgi:hypothetical protein
MTSIYVLGGWRQEVPKSIERFDLDEANEKKERKKERKTICVHGRVTRFISISILKFTFILFISLLNTAAIKSYVFPLTMFIKIYGRALLFY